MKVQGKYIAGRDIHIKHSNKKLKPKWSFWFGTGAVSVVCLLAFLLPNPTPSQFFVFKVLLAMGVGCVAASLPGFFQFTRAGFQLGGGILVFLLIFILDPLKTHLQTDTVLASNISGRIFKAGVPANGAKVHLPVFNMYTLADHNGEFSLPEFEEPLRFPLLLQVEFKGRDTLVKVDKYQQEVGVFISLEGEEVSGD